MSGLLSPQDALQEVLSSRTFGRSDQLKAFLRYVCEQELAGHGKQLNEYRIGVEALGRPADYDPTTDATVRNRAHALRKKLEEYYQQENPLAPLRIVLSKGSYCPVFETVPAGTPATSALPKRIPVHFVFVALAGLVLGALSGYRLSGPSPPRILKEAWGPLLNPDANTIVCLATPVHLFVRPGDTEVPKTVPRFPADQLLPWYSERSNVPPAEKLSMLPTNNSPLWGDAAAALIAARMFTTYGASWSFLPERTTTVNSLRGRNVLLLGRPEYSRLAGRLLRNLPITIALDGTTKEMVVVNGSPRPGERPIYIPVFGERHIDEGMVEVFGLITVLASEGALAGHERTIVVSGTNSAGSQAAAEFITSPEHLEFLRQRMEGGRLPLSFQVLVKATSNSTLPLNIAYVTHRVLSAQ